MSRSTWISVTRLALAAMLGLSACSGDATHTATLDGGSTAMPRQSLFQLEVLDGTWASLQLGYKLQPAWSALRRTYGSSTVAVTITEDDIESYQSSTQILTLTPRGSRAVLAKLARNDEERTHPEAALDQHAFVVVVGGTPIYGGVFIHPMSAMGINFPVIYASSTAGRLALTLRPIHSVLNEYGSQEPGWNGIKDPRVRDVFATAHKLLP